MDQSVASSLLVLYGLRIVGFHARKGPIIGALMMPKLVLYGRRLLEEQFPGTVLDIEVDQSFHGVVPWCPTSHFTSNPSSNSLTMISLFNDSWQTFFGFFLAEIAQPGSASADWDLTIFVMFVLFPGMFSPLLPHWRQDNALWCESCIDIQLIDVQWFSSNTRVVRLQNARST